MSKAKTPDEVQMLALAKELVKNNKKLGRKRQSFKGKIF